MCGRREAEGNNPFLRPLIIFNIIILVHTMHVVKSKWINLFTTENVVIQ